MLFFTSICHSTTLECLQLVKKRELGNYCSLECHRMTKARFWLLCWVTVLVWQHPFTSSFPGVLREQPMSLQAGRCLLFKSILFNLGVVLSGILSAQILAASVTPFVSKTHIENSQCGWQSTKAPEKPTLFLVCSMILTYFSLLFVVIVTLKETWSSFFNIDNRT